MHTLLLITYAKYKCATKKRIWCSGIIVPSHGTDQGSIPWMRTHFVITSSSFFFIPNPNNHWYGEFAWNESRINDIIKIMIYLFLITWHFDINLFLYISSHTPWYYLFFNIPNPNNHWYGEFAWNESRINAYQKKKKKKKVE